MLSANERRAEILAVINARRHDTIDKLAFEFGVSRRTMINDIQVLSISSPIYTAAGRYGGGVHMMDGQYAGRKYLTDAQTELLSRIYENLNADDQATLQSILKSFAVPEKWKRRL